jgi:hypothetical protein
MMRRIAVVLTALPLVSGFSATPLRGNRFDTACAMATDPQSIMTGILLAGSAAAAIQEYRTDKFEAVKDFTKSQKGKKEVDTVPAKKAAAVVKSEPVAAVKKVAAAKVAEVKAVASPVEAAAPDAPKPKTVVKPKYADESPTLSRSPPPPTPSAALTDLVQQVGNTVEKNKEIEDRVKARRMKEEEETAAEEKEKEDAATPEEAAGETEGKKRGTLRKAWRLTKKVVAPWRKWKNIS